MRVGTRGAMNSEYETKKRIGNAYEDFVSTVLVRARGIVLSSYISREFQLKGENVQGIEIKFDNKLESTGNIYIEYEEKSDKNNEKYVRSGIYRSDNTWLFVIGNRTEFFVFSKKMLQLLHSSKRYKEKETPTSRGFLLQRAIGIKFAAWYYHDVNFWANKGWEA